MADKKESKKSNEQAATALVTQSAATNHARSPLWYVLGTLIAVVFIILLAGAFKQTFIRQDTGRFERSAGFGFDDRHMTRGGMMGNRYQMNDDDHVSGVVTALNGSVLTVAGNGATKKVMINDSTEYYGAAQPIKVNDSVRIMGTTSGETFTATRIMISRQ